MSPCARSRTAPVLLGIVIAFLLGAPSAAQPAQPCQSGDSLLSLGKAAFFRSIERGAFAIGERTLEDLADGLGGANAAKPSSSLRRARATTTPVKAREAVFPRASDAALEGALAAYVEGPSSETADEAFRSFLGAATKILFETLPGALEAGRVGLVLEGGQLFNRNSTFAVQDMTSERKRESLQDSLVGGGPDLTPFFKAPVIADTRNVDRNNLGLTVKKEQDLRTLWFEDFRSYLATEDRTRSAAEIAEGLNAGWPSLQKLWAFKRTEIFIDRAQTAFGTELRQVNDRVTTEKLPARDCPVRDQGDDDLR